MPVISVRAARICDRTKADMNRVNPKKLLHSKWTAVEPRDREKHFVVTDVQRDEAERITLCVLEAVHSKREIEIDWRKLRDPARWKIGWQ